MTKGKKKIVGIVLDSIQFLWNIESNHLGWKTAYNIWLMFLRLWIKKEKAAWYYQSFIDFCIWAEPYSQMTK